MLVAVSALFVSLGGGAYAATQLPAHSVGSAQLRNGAVTAGKLANGAVSSEKVQRHSLLASDFKSGQLPTALGPQGVPGPTGATGPTGQQGSAGATGAPGAPGNGYDFTTASGTSGPTLTAAGSYLVFVRAGLANSGGTADMGTCGVSTRNFGTPTLGDDFVNAYSLAASAGTEYAFSGILIVAANDEDVTPSFGCQTGVSSNTDPTVSDIDWWVSPIGS